ncbi:hypothetical protein HD806DRAFT_492665 [Xylariaceae sp. AK1471]|nr:hypothetical protein HD806DRAFT_492665 [Xylariaceae sp. AK1471]
MKNILDQLQMSRLPASLLDRLAVEMIRELFKQAPNSTILATLLSTWRAMAAIMVREVAVDMSESDQRKRLSQQPERVVPSWMEAIQFYFRHVVDKSNEQLVLAWPAPAPAPITTPLVGDWGESLRWSRTLAEPPLDAMGEDHFRFMGRFMRYGVAAPDTFEMLALDAFEERLALSRKYGTWFAEQVSPGWRSGTPQKRYQERWEGGYDRLVWSFGIQGHPRADQIWKLMRARLPCDADPIMRTFPLDVTDIEPALRPETKAIRSWTFSYQALEFSIYEDQRGNFFLCHAKSREIRDVIRPRLAELWRATLHRGKSHSERLHCLAEFEWLWYWTNPFVRGGATTGSLLSAFLQRSLRDEGLKIRIRDYFVPQDLYVLSIDWRSYVRERVAEFACSKGQFITASNSVQWSEAAP